MAKFLREEVEPLDLLFRRGGDPYDVGNKKSRAILKPLQEEVKRRGLWACHLGPELGGPGLGQLKLALMNELLGRSLWGPTVFGTASPDTGNAEILAMFGTPEQKRLYLRSLMDGDIVSTYSMTEPQGGADPAEFTCAATRDGDEWVINGEKWFSSNARFASFLIVMAMTSPDAPLKSRMSMFIVPRETPGIEIIRNVTTIDAREELDEGIHAYIRYNNVRVPADALLGQEGNAFRIAQARLAGGRIHHAMRIVGQCNRALEMMCERAVSRHTQGTLLSEKQAVQQHVADSWIELQQFRLLVLHTAWTIDNKPHGSARLGISMCKVTMAKVLHDIAQRAIQLHGSLGITWELPLVDMWCMAPRLALADGPTEVHRSTVAKLLLKNANRAPGLFPSEHIPPKLEAARKRYAEILARED
jgi:acyl-CoA dehydrogenase